MEKETTYNGWTNYETWCVALWLTSEQATYTYWREQARLQWERAERTKDLYFTPSERAEIDFAKQLREEWEREDMLPAASLYGDLLRSALAEVNWNEVARDFLEDIRR